MKSRRIACPRPHGNRVHRVLVDQFFSVVWFWGWCLGARVGGWVCAKSCRITVQNCSESLQLRDSADRVLCPHAQLPRFLLFPGFCVLGFGGEGWGLGFSVCAKCSRNTVKNLPGSPELRARRNHFRITRSCHQDRVQRLPVS